MQDYTLDEKEKENYILKVRKNSNKTLDIVFANGRVFKNIEYNEENIEKIIKTQENQVDKAIAREKVFKDKYGYAQAATILSLSLSTAVSTIGGMVLVNNSIDPIIIGTGIGALMIFGNIPAACKLIKSRKRVAELEKLSYRNEHKEQLDQMKKYENALSGLPKKKQHLFRQKDAFSILNVDDFSKGDMETIVENIEKEESFQFVYKIKPEKTEQTEKNENEN